MLVIFYPQYYTQIYLVFISYYKYVCMYEILKSKKYQLYA